MSPRQIGTMQIIASGLCFGFLGTFGKLLFERGVAPGELLALRFATASALMFAFFLLRSPRLLRIDWRQLLSCAWLGVGGYALFAFCFFSALKGLSASLTVLLLYTYPAMVAIGAFILFKERIPRRQLWALPLAGFGLLALVWGELRIERMEALFFGFGSAFFYALYILISSRALRGMNPLISTPYIQLFAAIVLSFLYLHDGGRALSLVQDAWLLILGVAIICTVMAMSLFLAGLQKLKNWEVSLLSTTEPLTGVLLATLLLNESLTLPQLGGAFSIIASLVWISLSVPAVSAD